MKKIPTTAAEMNLPDAPESSYYTTGAHLRRHLSSVGDSRWTMPEPNFEKEFFMRNNNTFVQELAACADMCPLGAFGAFAETSIAPASATGNSIIDAIGGMVRSITPAVTARITGRTGTPVAATPAAAPPTRATWIPLAAAGAGVVLLIILMSRR